MVNKSRPNTVVIRCSPQEKEDLETLAKSLRISQADFVHALVRMVSLGKVLPSSILREREQMRAENPDFGKGAVAERYPRKKRPRRILSKDIKEP